jgi:hypothetical protein
VKAKSVDVPALPSLAPMSAITILHSDLRSCRWFLSPHPLPGFVEVGVVVLVVVDVDVLVEVEVLVDVEVLVEVLVFVDVVVGVVVVVVLVDVVVGVVVVVVLVEVEQYWYCDGVVQYW